MTEYKVYFWPILISSSNNKLWEEYPAIYPLMRQWSNRIRIKQFFVAARMSLPSWYLATISEKTARHKRSTIVLFLRVFVAAGSSLPCRCITLKGGIRFTVLLPTNGKRRCTHKPTDGRYLWIMQLRWAQMQSYTCQVS